LNDSKVQTRTKVGSINSRMRCPKIRRPIVALLAILVLLELRVAFHLGHEQDFPRSRFLDVPQQQNKGGTSLPEKQANHTAANIIPNNVPINIGGDSNSRENNNSCAHLESEHNSSMRVPRIIHQTYKSHDLPANYYAWREECKRLNPCWEFKLWTDQDNLKFVRQKFPRFFPYYMAYTAKIKRIDSVRYLILYLYGGVYFDLDMTCLRPFHERTFDKVNTFYVASQFDANVAPDLARGRYANAFMAASPRHSVLEEIINRLPSQRNKGVLKATGPRLLTSVVEQTTGNASVVAFNKDELFSTSYSDTEGIKLCATNRTKCMARYPGYMVSFWSSSWIQPGFEDGKHTLRKKRSQTLRLRTIRKQTALRKKTLRKQTLRRKTLRKKALREKKLREKKIQMQIRRKRILRMKRRNEHQLP
jgi:hypothetical protein